MSNESYMEFVRRLTSDQHEIASKKLTPENVHLLHALIGISGETGEKWDNFKRFLFYGQEIDRENLREELGDLLYYVGMAIDWLGTDFETIMQENMDKLNKRYASGKFSTKQAIDRADKKPVFVEIIAHQTVGAVDLNEEFTGHDHTCGIAHQTPKQKREADDKVDTHTGRIFK